MITKLFRKKKHLSIQNEIISHATDSDLEQIMVINYTAIRLP